MPQNTLEQIGALIQLLESFGKRPQMYLARSREPYAAQAFLDGVAQTVLTLLGVNIYVGARWDVWRDRGWDQGGARGPIWQMQQQGMGDKAIVDELIAMEIEVWKRVVSGGTR